MLVTIPIFGFSAASVALHEAIYKNPCSYLNILHNILVSFAVARGVGSRCPLSPTMFTLTVERLLVDIIDLAVP